MIECVCVCVCVCEIFKFLLGKLMNMTYCQNFKKLEILPQNYKIFQIGAKFWKNDFLV
jgi:hypothetical protein